MTWAHPKYVGAAQIALDANAKELRLESGMSPDVQLWHMLLSLLNYSDAHGIDFDALLEELRTDDPSLRDKGLIMTTLDEEDADLIATNIAKRLEDDRREEPARKAEDRARAVALAALIIAFIALLAVIVPLMRLLYGPV